MSVNRDSEPAGGDDLPGCTWPIIVTATVIIACLGVWYLIFRWIGAI